MKRILAIMVLLAALTGCDSGIDDGRANNSVARIEYPTVNLPVSLRQQNWRGTLGEGSCVHASLISLFRWQGRYWMANHWRATYGNGEVADESWGRGSNNLRAKLEHEGVRFAYTVDGDVAFLEWACYTRRGCGVTINGGRHMVALVHLDSEWAGLLDNNQVNTIIWVPRDQFISEWHASNSFAVAPVYTPAPPL